MADIFKKAASFSELSTWDYRYACNHKEELKMKVCVRFKYN
jgi:hypothetical protein